jgi:hypothetical protein
MANRWQFVYPMEMGMVKKLAPLQLVGMGMENFFCTGMIMIEQ